MWRRSASAELKPQSADDIRKADHVIATFSDEMAETDRQIKAMLFKRIYRNHDIMRIRAGAAQIVKDLFGAYMANPRRCRAIIGSTISPAFPMRRKRGMSAIIWPA